MYYLKIESSVEAAINKNEYQETRQGCELCRFALVSYYGLRIFNVVLTLLLPRVAVMVTGFLPPPNLPVRVVITKVAEVAPSGTMTTGGTVAFPVSLLLSVTETPPAGAAPFNVTVPVALAGAVTVVGFTVRFSRVDPSGIVTVAVALLDNAD